MTIRRKRTPDGVNHGKPIALRLMPAEREQAELVSKRIGKTKSALAREAYLIGLPFIINNFPMVETSPAVASSGADGIVSTASFYTSNMPVVE